MTPRRMAADRTARLTYAIVHAVPTAAFILAIAAGVVIAPKVITEANQIRMEIDQ